MKCCVCVCVKVDGIFYNPSWTRLVALILSAGPSGWILGGPIVKNKNECFHLVHNQQAILLITKEPIYLSTVPFSAFLYVFRPTLSMPRNFIMNIFKSSRITKKKPLRSFQRKSRTKITLESCLREVHDFLHNKASSRDMSTFYTTYLGFLGDSGGNAVVLWTRSVFPLQ